MLKAAHYLGNSAVRLAPVLVASPFALRQVCPESSYGDGWHSGHLDQQQSYIQLLLYARWLARAEKNAAGSQWEKLSDPANVRRQRGERR